MSSTHVTQSLAAATAFAVTITLSSAARADKLLLLADYGNAENERVLAVKESMEKAGHEPVIGGSSLEDTALLLGCDATRDSCLDSVITTGNVDGLIIVPTEEGEILVRRQKENARFPIPAEGGFDAAVGELAAAMAQTDAGDTKTGDTTGDTTGAAPDVAVDGDAEVTGNVAGPGDSTGQDPLLGAEPSKASESGFSMSRISTRSWLVLGGGVAATGLGLGLLGIASSKQSDVDSHPVETAEDLEALRRLEDSGASYTTAGNLVTVIGGVAVLAGVGLVYLDMKKGTTAEKLAILPTANADGFGVALQWNTP